MDIGPAVLILVLTAEEEEVGGPDEKGRRRLITVTHACSPEAWEGTR